MLSGSSQSGKCAKASGGMTGARAPCDSSGNATRMRPYNPNFFSTPAWSIAVAVGAEP